MRQIFVNLPVKDLERSKRFFEGLGFSINPRFTDENAACVVVEQNVIHVMLLKESYFSRGPGVPLVREPQDHGFMVQHAFEDPDGHIRELVHLRSEPQ